MKFSVVVPVYNGGDFLYQCVDSIINQSYEELELLLINDGSSDRSLDICREYEARDGRIRVISHENAGVSYTKNVGIAAATGDYMIFIDADDYVDTNLLELVCEKLKQGDYEAVFYGFQFEDESKKQLAIAATKNNQFFKGKQSEGVYELINDNVFGYQCTKAFMTSVIKENTIAFDESLSLNEDLLFTCDFMSYVERVGSISDAPYHYICHDDSLSKKYRSDLYQIEELTLIKYAKFLNDLEVSHREQLILKRAVFSIMSIIKGLGMPECSLSKSEKRGVYRMLVDGYFYDVLEKYSVYFKEAVEGKKRLPLYLSLRFRSGRFLGLISRLI